MNCCDKASDPNSFVWGVRALDKMLVGSLRPGTTVLIAGNPGAGKTILAASICYVNAFRGVPCLYVSLQESREKFLWYMARLGMNFSELEEKGLFEYRDVPLIVDRAAVGHVLEDIISAVTSHGHRVIVIDSFTPIGLLVGGTVEAREVLQNFFYNLARLTKGLVVIVAEVPYGSEKIELGGIEFVADIVIMLKQKVENGFITRLMEVRKIRGAPITTAEIPFTIVEGKGLVACPPPMIEDIPAPRREVKLQLPCTALEEAIGPLYPGHHVTVFYPPDGRARYLLVPLLAGFILSNKLRTLIISYERSPEEIMDGLVEQLGELAGDAKERLEELVRVTSFNPASMSLEELYARELQEIEEYQPLLLVFDRSDIPYLVHGTRDEHRYYMYLRNELLMFRSKGMTTIRVLALIDEKMYRLNTSMADIVLRLTYRRSGEQHRPRLYVWRNGRNPKVLGPAALEHCRSEVQSVIGGLLGSRVG
ncbi:ATPase domain-containing protein [Hyperthermus butylicus]|uniref:RecA ATPase n=1 Tax=Hyperthermus butylicus (strain DSM 5456 / JCM 9403 / PLM1-5) TaxID=415426 RepID=A2BKH9_HYPBU|nr:ATPase domain-containing protein [Hyperthermus butylicus]ABM80490.1 putative RecA ATPase [Hyperthermus butylicus DSM 5456]